MRAMASGWAAALALAAPLAFAQAGGEAANDAAACVAERAALERDMQLARSRGQMLRRRQLADTLAALNARCDTLTAPQPQSRAAHIRKLEQEIEALQKALDLATEQLRQLRSEAP
ncbi:DUF1090 family protein [Xenophilus azovorans]|uniref:DUF1090 family protein n=1 Tax=Xenophilus azovorans TaxID=151755 RepID=UPI000A05456C|nr:DUF1090 family protein [Xenophilus azovorans]